MKQLLEQWRDQCGIRAGSGDLYLLEQLIATKIVESQTTAVQQLKAEIAALAGEEIRDYINGEVTGNGSKDLSLKSLNLLLSIIAQAYPMPVPLTPPLYQSTLEEDADTIQECVSTHDNYSAYTEPWQRIKKAIKDKPHVPTM